MRNVLPAMEKYFGNDSRFIDHARRVTGYAAEILASEGGDPAIVIPAAVLHDIGIHEAERKYGSTLGKFQEIEGPPIARYILKSLGFGPTPIAEICRIIAHHHSPGKVKTKNFTIVYDADWLVNLRDEYDIRDANRLRTIMDRVYLTESGKALARALYLK